MSKTKSAPRPRSTWRDNDDRHHRTFPSWPSAESLHPNEMTMIAAIEGDSSARAIIGSYAAHLFSAPEEVLS
jgi:hypothetical protein